MVRTARSAPSRLAQARCGLLHLGARHVAGGDGRLGGLFGDGALGRQRLEALGVGFGLRQGCAGLLQRGAGLGDLVGPCAGAEEAVGLLGLLQRGLGRVLAGGCGLLGAAEVR
ncbi:MAG: hypothetical protein NT029_07655 [Armatimonadetes bacterium]|nr:hypothetical protein [Armatimonadota bacterium]